MTPRLRLTFRCLRLPAVLTAAALPWYGIAVVHGSPPAHAAEPGPAPASAPSHGEGRQGPARDAPPGRSVPQHPSPGRSAGPHSAGARPHARHPDAGDGAPEEERPERDHPDRDDGERDHPGQERPGHGRPGREPSASARPPQKDSATPVPMPSDSASASVHPYRSVAWSEPTRAGSRAGEGRMRPGRPDRPGAETDDDSATATPAVQPAEPETTDVPAASEGPAREAGPGSTPPAPRPGTRQASRPSEAVTESSLRILPLGSGLVLIGLGLGLALLGLRLRRS
ncbi:hypothetical protein [Streptomyces eurythermus]